MAPAKRVPHDTAEDEVEGTVSGRVSKRRRRMVMRLHIIRGNLNTAESDALPAGIRRGGGSAQAAASAMDDNTFKVWSDLPTDILCKILLLVPPVKRFQFQLVSRQWRQMLTSAHFSHAVVAHERQQTRRDDPVVACILLGNRSLVPAAAAVADTSGQKRKQAPAVVDIDLSFVPSQQFWGSEPSSYAVVAVGGGLVCISDRDGCLHHAKHLCVLNPLTRTCKVVPKVPFPRMRWRGTTQLTHLHAGALTVLVATSGAITRDWVLAMYDLETGGGWTLVRLASPGGDPGTWSHPVNRRHFVMCRGESYCYRRGKVYVHTVNRGAGALEETARVAIPAAAADHHRMIGFRNMALVERQDRVFFIGLVREPIGPLARSQPQLWRIWTLLPDCETWHQVAELGKHKLNKLTGFRYADCHSLGVMQSACAAGELLCFELRIIMSKAMMGNQGKRLGTIMVTLGFNLQTSQWELVYDQELFKSNDGLSFELMPNSFLF